MTTSNRYAVAGRRLLTAEEIADAGADAVADWKLSDEQAEKLAALVADSLPQAKTARPVWKARAA